MSGLISDGIVASVTRGASPPVEGEFTSAPAWRARFTSGDPAWSQRYYTTFTLARGDGVTPWDQVARPGTPGWTSVPTVTGQTDTAYSIGASRDTTCVLYGVAVVRGDPAPSSGQIILGQNAAGSTAKAAASSASGSGSVSLTLTPSDSPAFPVYDLYFVLANALGSSSVQSLTNEMLDAPTGFLFKQLASVSSSGALAFTIAAPGDVWKTDDNTDEDAYPLTLMDSGDFVIAAASDLDRISFTQWLYDVSAAAWVGPGQVYINNNAPAPVSTPLAFPSGLLFEQNSTITPFDLADECDDVESDTFTVAVMLGAWPTGLSLGSGPTYTLSGTPTEYGRSEITLRWTDSLGDYYEEQVYVNVGPKLPDVVGLTVAAAQAALALASLTITYLQAYSETVDAGDIISMSPVALTVVPYDQVVTLTVSLGPEP